MADSPPQYVNYEFASTAIFQSGILCDVVQHIELAFHKMAVAFLQSEHVKYWYACSVFNNDVDIRFEVTVYSHNHGFMVELRHSSGCSVVFERFAKTFMQMLE